MSWLFAIYGSICAAVAIYYCIECSRLRTQQVGQRDALRERDRAGREHEQRAFQDGYRIGMQNAQAIMAEDVEVDCPCPACRAERFGAN